MILRKIVLVLTSLCLITNAQRPFYAGRPPTFEKEAVTSNAKFPNLPIEIGRNVGLLQRIEQMPPDKRPFCILKWQWAGHVGRMDVGVERSSSGDRVSVSGVSVVPQLDGATTSEKWQASTGKPKIGKVGAA
ncbi:jg2619 [Pararge aegeria aegeria]|uniref:Jg2619 protein n=1 Tax=Pararge aegeria aegeria TaxID=348720 RepID=A0A8S4R577_9NEOP|nr:jg2619 [Pararge aegeria aegeria]